MKNKVYSIFYLVIITFYLLRPVLPYVDYTFNKDYISKYLCAKKDLPGNCCQGKCYLNKQLQKNSEPTDSDRDSNNKKSQDKRMDDHFKANAVGSAPSVNDFTLIIYYKISVSDSFLFPAFVPPKG